MVYVFVDARLPSYIIENLRVRGFTPLPLPLSQEVSAPVCGHVDLSVLRVGERLFVRKSIYDNLPVLHRDERVIPVNCPCIPQYPDETALCAKVLGRRIFANTGVLAKEVVEYAKQSGYEITDTRQGYVGCSLLTPDSTHAITADRGLARTLRQCDIEVLEIQNGAITLPPYEYGFIGGASGVYQKTVYFLGDIGTHPDGAKISEYIVTLGYDIRCLGAGELFDGGGLLFWESKMPVTFGQNP